VTFFTASSKLFEVIYQKRKVSKEKMKAEERRSRRRNEERRRRRL